MRSNGNFNKIANVYNKQHNSQPYIISINYLTASSASPIASSDQGVGFDRDNSIPSLLHLPYNVPVGIPNSVDAFCTDV